MYTINNASFPCKLFAMLSYTFSTLMCIWSSLIIFQFFAYQLESLGLIGENKQATKKQLLMKPKIIISTRCKYYLLCTVYTIPFVVYVSLLSTNHFTQDQVVAECIVTPNSLDIIYWLPILMIYIISVIIVSLTCFTMRVGEKLQSKLNDNSNNAGRSLIKSEADADDDQKYNDDIRSHESHRSVTC